VEAVTGCALNPGRAMQPVPGLAGGEPLEPGRVAQRLLGGGEGLLGLPGAAVFGDPASSAGGPGGAYGTVPASGTSAPPSFADLSASMVVVTTTCADRSGEGQGRANATRGASVESGRHRGGDGPLCEPELLE
jgi:hypothetical protein